MISIGGLTKDVKATDTAVLKNLAMSHPLVQSPTKPAFDVERRAAVHGGVQHPSAWVIFFRPSVAFPDERTWGPRGAACANCWKKTRCWVALLPNRDLQDLAGGDRRRRQRQLEMARCFGHDHAARTILVVRACASWASRPNSQPESACVDA